VLLLTSDQTVDRQTVADAGIHACLSKPLRHSELYDALVDVLGVGSEPADTPTSAPATGSPAGAGVRVLVVEDNQVNQLVATGLLESLGCTVDVAADGAEAVERLTRPHEYAAVLMDCRMPRLDGFDATREIRRKEGPGSRVPVIALTASALEGERERCLAAGMDDYLTKPVDAADLERVIRQWARPADVGADASIAPAVVPPGGTDDDVLDPERVEMLDELRKDGVSFFERTAASFMGRVGGQVVAIRDAAAQDSAMSLLTAAHQLKGSALNLGLPRVAEAAARLEALGVAGTTTGAEPLVDELTREVEVAVAALQRATAGRR